MTYPLKTANHAMERTATRFAFSFCMAKNLFASSDARSRWQSLILFSLDADATSENKVRMKTFLIILAAALLASCATTPSRVPLSAQVTDHGILEAIGPTRRERNPSAPGG